MRRGAVLLVLANLAVIAGLAVAVPDLMVSPGRLVEGHRDVQRDCFACHTAFAGTPTAKCIACHDPQEIGRAGPVEAVAAGALAQPGASRMPGDAAPPFHGALEDTTCTRCHSDHRGRRAETVQGPAFAHGLLTEARRADCAGCHAAPQNDTLHANTRVTCQSCHDTEGWTPAGFAHDRLAADAPSDCTACHRAPKDSLHAHSSGACAVCHGLDTWVPAIFEHRYLARDARRDCTACHSADEPADALHAGTDGPYCGACHGTRAWEPARFEHWHYFPLHGDHAAACDTCHRSTDFRQYTCYGCHAHDRRSVRFEHDEEDVAADSDCVDCHRHGEDD